MAEPEENRPTQLYDSGFCVICKGVTQNQSETPCGHVACYECLKEWGQMLVHNQGMAKATCPKCRHPFSKFWHTNGRPFTLYKQGHGAKGKLKHARRVRRRRRGKQNGAAAKAPNAPMDVD